MSACCFPEGVCREEVSRDGSGRMDLLAAPLHSAGTHLWREERKRDAFHQISFVPCVNIFKVEDDRSIDRVQSCEGVKEGKPPLMISTTLAPACKVSVLCKEN